MTTKKPRPRKAAPAGGGLAAFAEGRTRRDWSPRTDDPAQVDLEDLTRAPAPKETGREAPAVQAVTFRLRRTTHRRLMQTALDLSDSEGRKVHAVELVERALADYFRRLGLPED